MATVLCGAGMVIGICEIVMVVYLVLVCELDLALVLVVGVFGTGIFFGISTVCVRISCNGRFMWLWYVGTGMATGIFRIGMLTGISGIGMTTGISVFSNLTSIYETGMVILLATGISDTGIILVYLDLVCRVVYPEMTNWYI